jgi:alpha-tubulin suppressor-like RCC1 family protein/endonuclease/exonuclease/phosphatase family metal-dependent hydrolase
MGNALTRPLRDRRLVVGVVAVVLVGALLVSFGHWGRSDHPRAEQAARTTGQRTAPGCADALLIGVNGNGERPVDGRDFGRTVNAVVRRVAAKAKRHGRRIVVRSVPLTTQRPKAVLRDHRRPTSHTMDVVAHHRVRLWRSPVAGGVRDTLAELATVSTRCPDRPVLLVGYAQGAAVIHRVLTRISAEGGLAGLVGGVLISDPERKGHSVAAPVLGDPAAGQGHGGLFRRELRPQHDVPRPRGSYAVWSVCDQGDLVCDPSQAPVRSALAAARGYVGSGTASPGTASRRGVSSALRVVAQQAWRQLALWPVPTPRSQVLAGIVGDPVQVQLTVAPGTRGAIAWTEATGLPHGLTLSASGLLSGTPKHAGTFEVTYRASNTEPATTGHTGSLLIKITPDSVSLSAGGQTTCQTRSDGSARCWGRNDYGQVGDGTTTLRDVPATVLRAGKSGWASLSTSGASTCGIKQNGTLWCWGLDNYGQLGIGRRGPVHRPHQVGTRKSWASVSAAWTHTCAIRTNGALYCWGQNLWGQLGIGSVNRLHGTPQRVGTAQWRSVTTAGWHTCAIDIAGTAYCWGHNAFGEVGDGTTATRSAPVKVDGGQTWLQLSSAWAQTCGITQAGRLLCWGFNRQGQLGDGTLTNRAEPAPVDATETWTQVTAGDGSTCATASDARLWCWGDDRYGQLGTPASEQPVPTPTLVSALTSPVQLISSGWLHTCVIPVGGSFTCWGNDEAGQLGDGAVQTVKNLHSVRPAPTHQVDLRRRDLPSDRFLDHASASRIAHAALASRPALAGQRPHTRGRRESRRADLTPFTVMTMNMLGSQHTAPGGDEPNMAPGRLRAEWASTYFGMRSASLVGMQEPQPDQIVALDSATRHTFRFYPGNSIGYDGAPQSVIWKRVDWKLIWHSSISIPFTSGWRPQPIVELQQRATGAQLYWINVHFSARRGNQAARNKAMKILLKAIHQLKDDHLPVLVTGDFNEVVPAFCSITGKTTLVAATGGSNTGDGGTDGCVPPRGARIDWIFGSDGTFSHPLVDDSAQVRRTTDHHVVSAQFGTGQ